MFSKIPYFLERANPSTDSYPCNQSAYIHALTRPFAKLKLLIEVNLSINYYFCIEKRTPSFLEQRNVGDPWAATKKWKLFASPDPRMTIVTKNHSPINAHFRWQHQRKKRSTCVNRMLAARTHFITQAFNLLERGK